jgi:hypothetical protein
VNIIDHTIERPQCFLNITLEGHKEVIKEATRKARMEVINKLDQESREKLKKQEFKVYTRPKRMNQPLSTRPTTSQPKSPPMNILLPKTSPKADKIDLKFDLEAAFSKMHVTIPLREAIKVPSMKERFKFFFNISDESMDPPIMLQEDCYHIICILKYRKGKMGQIDVTGDNPITVASKGCLFIFRVVGPEETSPVTWGF